jgi:hypothetical protein
MALALVGPGVQGRTWLAPADLAAAEREAPVVVPWARSMARRREALEVPASRHPTPRRRPRRPTRLYLRPTRPHHHHPAPASAWSDRLDAGTAFSPA